MFKVESYITPIILSQVERYVKNIRAEDSQVSLWGGDAVFNNLDLRLDVLEEELQLPFSLVSGHIHELQIHVPWTRLHTEPIVLTINTIECVLKLPTDVRSLGSVLNLPLLLHLVFIAKAYQPIFSLIRNIHFGFNGPFLNVLGRW